MSTFDRRSLGFGLRTAVFICGAAAVMSACSATESASPPNPLPATSATSAPTTPARPTTPGKVDLHIFDGTWGVSNQRFQAVACAIQDFNPPIPGRAGFTDTPSTSTTSPRNPAGTTPPAWNRGSGCGFNTNGRAFAAVQVLTIDGASVIVRFFDGTCTATMNSDDPGVNDETAVHIDQIVCDGRAAPAVDTTLQLSGTDTLIAGGVAMPRRDPNIPFVQGTTTTRAARAARAIPPTTLPAPSTTARVTTP